MPLFDNEGVKIYYEIEGEGPPVITIHGFDTSEITRKMRPKLPYKSTLPNGKSSFMGGS